MGLPQLWVNHTAQGILNASAILNSCLGGAALAGGTPATLALFLAATTAAGSPGWLIRGCGAADDSWLRLLFLSDL